MKFSFAMLVFRLSTVLHRRSVRIRGVRFPIAQFYQGLRHPPARVVVWIPLIVRAVVDDAPDYDLGVVTPRQSTLCEGPIVLGLAQGIALGQWFTGYFLVLMSRCVLRVKLEPKIAVLISLR